jgi:rubrerythrin
MNKTIQNLSAAFVGESQARNRYTIYAKTAKKEGFEQVAAIFEETADQEREHAKWLMRMINEIKDESEEKNTLNPIVLTEAEVPNTLATTVDNLKAAINGENYEHTKMYPEFADIADEEGYPKIASRLRAIARAEEHHEQRYAKLIKQIKADSLFKKEEETSWICRKCGYMHQGQEAPGECPSCGHPQAYFQLQCEKY